MHVACTLHADNMHSAGFAYNNVHAHSMHVHTWIWHITSSIWFPKVLELQRYVHLQGQDQRPFTNTGTSVFLTQVMFLTCNLCWLMRLL